MSDVMGRIDEVEQIIGATNFEDFEESNAVDVKNKRGTTVVCVLSIPLNRGDGKERVSRVQKSLFLFL